MLSQSKPAKRTAIAVAVQLAIGTALITPLAFAQTSQAANAIQVDQQQAYNINRGSLNKVLNQFAEQSGLYLTADAALTKAKFSAGLNGKYTRRQALDKILQGTDISYSLQNNTITLRQDSTHEVMMLAATIVTGEKLNRDIQDTNTSITVFSGEDFDNAQYTNISEVISKAVNTISDPNDIPTIRGIDGNGAAVGGYSFTSGARPRVSTVVDGKTDPFISVLTGDTGVWDIEQVEVLRGSQSTIMGRNSIGGAAVVNTKDPTFDWQGAARLGYKDQDAHWEAAGMISGPIVDDQLAFRVAVQQVEAETFLNFPVPEGQPDYPFDPKTNSATNIRAKLLWQPAALSDFSAKLTFSQRDEQGTRHNWVDGSDYYEYNVDYGPWSSLRDYDTNNTSLMLDLSYQLSPQWVAEVKLSTMKYDWAFDQFLTFSVDMEEKNQTLDAKLSYQSEDEKINGFIAAYIFDREQDLVNNIYYNGDDKTETRALYGEGYFKLLEKVTFVVGGRLEQEKQYRNMGLWGFEPATSFIVDEDYNEFLPKLGVNYHVSEEVTLGISAREGFTAGGGNINYSTSEVYTFDSEYSWTYEFSVRSSFLEERLRVNANVFFNEFEDYQEVDVGMLGNRIDYGLINIAGVETYGLEIEAQALITENLQLSAGIGLLDTEITEVGPSQSEERVGNQLGYAADTTAFVAVNYYVLEDLYVNVSSQYTSDFYSSFANDNKVAGYLVTDAAVNYTWDKVQFRLFANNITDKKYAFNSDGDWGANVGKPRQVGLSATLSF